MAWGAVIGAIVAIIGMIANSSQADKQAKNNMDLAKFQSQANENYLQKQLDYNTPASQMGRFQAAGLNPHLIYGQGSPGNQSAPLTFPDIKPADYQRQNLDQLIPLANQSMMVQSQVQAQNAATGQKHAQTELIKLQAKVLEKNPALNKETYEAMVQSWLAAAQIKMGDAKMKTELADVMTKQQSWSTENSYFRGTQTARNVQQAYDLLEQKFQLGQKDAQIKAQIINSKDFQNELLRIQKEFLVDGNVGPQQFWQFLLLLISKSF